MPARPSYMPAASLERHFTCAGSGSFKLNNDQDRVISHMKADLEEVLAHSIGPIGHHPVKHHGRAPSVVKAAPASGRWSLMVFDHGVTLHS